MSNAVVWRCILHAPDERVAGLRPTVAFPQVPIGAGPFLGNGRQATIRRPQKPTRGDDERNEENARGPEKRKTGTKFKENEEIDRLRKTKTKTRTVKSL